MDAALDRACDPKRTDRERGAAMTKFVNFVNKEQDGPQIAMKLLIAKYQSSTEAVVMSALEVTESCVRSCGKRFHDEIGKFRFLNELIKLVSPKYAADRTPPAAKKKIKLLIFNWSEGLNHHPKIREAFMMLKNQGLVRDEDLPKAEDATPRERIGPAVFEDENRSALLKRLLQSKHPEDLEAANRLIKDMVKKDNQQMTDLSKRIAEMEMCQNNIKLLTEMLAHYESGQNHEIITELHKSCLEMRTKLQNMATEVDEGGDQMTEIFQLSDELTKVLQLHDRKMAGATASSGGGAAAVGSAPVTLAAAAQSSQAADDDFDLLGGIGSPTVPTLNPPPNGGGDLDNLFSLDPLGGPAMASGGAPAATSGSGSASLLDDLAMLDLGGGAASAAPTATGLMGMSMGAPASNPLDGLMGGGMSMSMGAGTSLMGGGGSPQVTAHQATAGAGPVQPQAPGAGAATTPGAVGGDLYVALDSIQMSTKAPLVGFDKNGLRMLVFSAQNVPQPNVQVYVVQTMNTSPVAITNFSFQAAVPKSQRVKLQPASGESLPAHNPLGSPATVTQVMLIANPAQEPLRLRFKLDFVANGTPFSDVGQVEG